MESIEDYEVEANDDKELDKNELKFDIDEDLHQREKESQSNESNADIEYLLIILPYSGLVIDNKQNK